MKRDRNPSRRGAAAVESALVLSGMFLLVLGGLEIGLLTLRHVSLAEASRRCARAMVVRGDNSAMTAMGPTATTCTAADDNSVAVACRVMLPTMSSDEVTIDVTWPNDSNNLDDPVEVNLSYPHHFIVPLLNHDSPLVLRASSRMSITH